jgi:lysophospholipase L1-like esterase
MNLHAYGDSWTEGQGTTDDRKEWKNYSWVKIVSDKLGIMSINNGVSGNSNLNIFNKVVDDLIEYKIKSDDIVVIMWSSSLRDLVPFLPKNEWVSWSVKHLVEYPHKFVESYQSENVKYNNFLYSFKELFITDLFNQNYYNIVNQNYIIFLQKMFEFYKIKYVMFDAFESMIIDLNKNDSKIDIIDKNYYWEFNNKTIRNFLNNTNRPDIWEHIEDYKNRPTQHPNIEGYKIISEIVYDFIIKNYFQSTKDLKKL